ncbi:MAG: hypothetical protein D6820_15755, partial [Lentisphaerae bacterium]
FGNYYANIRAYRQAIDYLMRVVNELPQSKEVPEALYEAAKAAYNEAVSNGSNDFGRALSYLGKIEKMPTDHLNNARVQAQAKLLHGDILSILAQYYEAAQNFAECRNLARGISLRLYFRATGRLGDMMYVQAGTVSNPTEKEKLLKQALKYYEEIVTSFGFDFPMRQKALYHCGLVHKMMENMPLAEQCFRDVFENYFVQVRLGQVPVDWFYCLKAGMELVHYYRQSGQPYAAVWVYDRIARAGIPTFSPWARSQAEKIRRQLVGSLPPRARKLLDQIFQVDLQNPGAVSTARGAITQLQQEFPELARRWETPIKSMQRLLKASNEKENTATPPQK